MIRFLTHLFVVCGLLAAPYLYFQIRINEAFLGSAGAGAWDLLRYAKFVAYALTVPAILMGLWFALKKFQNKAMILVGLAAFLYAAAMLIVTNYHNYFGLIPHWNQLGHLDESGAIGGQIIEQLLSWEDGLMTLSVIVGTAALFFLKSPNKRVVRFVPIMLLFPAVVLFAIQVVRHPLLPTINGRGYTMACSHYGIAPTYLVMLKDFLPHKMREVSSPVELSAEEKRSDQFGALQGSNVLVVQVESMDSGLVGRTVGGELVMPFFTKLTGESVYFPDCVAMHAGGGSSDAELAALLSLVPLTSGSGLASADWNRAVPLSKILNNEGYHCVAMHSNRGSFYDRGLRYREMGFAKFYDQKAFTGAAAGWYAKDDAFFSQSLELLKSGPKPFLGYWITMQSHGPFRNYNDETRRSFGPSVLEGLEPLEIGYASTFREVDEALSQLFRDLRSSGLLDSTLVIIYGDHESIAAENGNLAGERVPLILSHPKLSAAKGTGLASHIDIAPTVTDLLGLNGEQSWLGSSLFAEKKGIVQVVLPGGAAVTSTDALSEERNEAAFNAADYSRALLGN